MPRVEGINIGLCQAQATGVLYRCLGRCCLTARSGRTRRSGCRIISGEPRRVTISMASLHQSTGTGRAGLKLVLAFARPPMLFLDGMVGVEDFRHYCHCRVVHWQATGRRHRLGNRGSSRTHLTSLYTASSQLTSRSPSPQLPPTPITSCHEMSSSPRPSYSTTDRRDTAKPEQQGTSIGSRVGQGLLYVVLVRTGASTYAQLESAVR